MKIITSGHKGKPWVGKEFSCDRCGCVFRLEAKDKPKYHSDQRDGDCYLINCPECKKPVTMSIEAILRIYRFEP